MIVLEITEDKFGKIMKVISKITEHAECLLDIFEDIAESDEYGDRKKHDDGSYYSSRYGMRRGSRHSY